MHRYSWATAQFWKREGLQLAHRAFLSSAINGLNGLQTGGQ